VDILLVEDNILNQKVIVFNLKKLNYNVIPVDNGKDAIDKFLNTSFDLILMDLMLPVMNGYEITREIRRLEKEKGVENEIPIIAITANVLDNDRDKCFEVGMNEFMTKPFTAEQLIEKIRIFIAE
jgi:osomolarity two-component system sensor histidine kinase NIK1